MTILCFVLVPIFRKELKYLDLHRYFPEKLSRKNLVSLSELIFHNDCYVKSELRRGVWMHLLGVFHPGKETLEERETYIENLRRVYDTLKVNGCIIYLMDGYLILLFMDS